MEAIALSKKNQKKIQKVVAKGHKKALKANKQAKKLVHQLPGKAEKAYKSYTPKDVQKIVNRVVSGKAPVKKKPPFAAIAGVASAVVVVVGLGAALVSLLKGGDNLSVSE